MESRQAKATPESAEADKSVARDECRRGGHRHGGRRIVGVLLVAMLAVAAGFAGGYASRGYGWGGPQGFLFGAMDPTRSEQSVDRMIARLADKVDATPEQKEKLNGIAQAAAKDLLALRGNVYRNGLPLLVNTSRNWKTSSCWRAGCPPNLREQC